MIIMFNVKATFVVRSAPLMTIVITLRSTKWQFLTIVISFFNTTFNYILKLKTIQELNNIRFVYLSVEQKNGELVFSRKMLEGTGEANYGITIAKYILDEPEFIESAIKFKNELLEQQGVNYKLVNDKKSLYNKDIYMDANYPFITD